MEQHIKYNHTLNNVRRGFFSNLFSSTAVLLLAVLLSSCGHAQNNDYRRSNSLSDSLFSVVIDTSYSFIAYDSNRLVIPGDSSRMKAFAEKWYRVLQSGRGHVSIMQIGASHVQGGTFPHQIRRNLLLSASSSITRGAASDSIFPISDRGMLFPYSAAVKCNNPFDYKVSRSHPLTLTRNVYKEPLERLGLCGIAVTASDSTAVIGISMNEPDLSFPVHTILILGESPAGVTPQVKHLTPAGDTVALKLLNSDKSKRSFTFQSDIAIDSFLIVLPCKEGETFALTGVYLAASKGELSREGILPRPQHGITYHSIGVNGASVSDYLTKCPYLTTDLKLLKPDLVIFGIGINDAAGPNFDSAVFARRYLELVDSIRTVNPECAFIFITNNDSYKRVKRKYVVNNNGALAHDAFYRVAKQCGGAVWDQFTIMGGLKSMDRWCANELAQRDHIHFNRKGYQLLADLFSNALLSTIQSMKPVQKTVKPAEQQDSLKVQEDSKPKPIFKNKKQRSDSLTEEELNERYNYILY